MRFPCAALLAIAALNLSCGGGFDLVVELLTVPASVGAGEPFTTHSRVCNRGGAASTPAFVELKLQPLSPPGPLVAIGVYGVPPLEAGECHSQEWVSIAPAGRPDGSYRLFGRATPGNRERLASAIFGIGFLPDLRVEQLVGPPSVAPGVSFDVSGLACNRGTVWAPGADVSLYLSSDAQLVGALGGAPSPDLFLGNALFPGLAPEACFPFELAVSAAVPLDGLYQLGAIVDEANSVSELVEEDNARLMAEIAVGWLPDLIVASLAAPNTTLNGAIFEVEGVVCNQGTLPSPPSQVLLLFSEDGVIEPPGGGPMPEDFPLGPLPVPWLPPGDCHTQRSLVSANVPSEGAWTLGAIVDVPGVVEEFSDANNAFAGPLVGVGFGPDLVVEAIDAPASAGEFAEFAVSVRACNRGTSYAESSQLRLFHSSDGVLDALPFGDDPEIGVAPVGPLPPGACLDMVVNAIASSLLTGPVTLIALADAFAQVDELLESNNETAGPVMGIGWKPDLIVVSITAPASAHAGSLFEVTLEVCNQGTQPSPPSMARFYHSADAVLAGISGPPPFPDWFAGEISIPHPLMPGACSSVDATLLADPGAQGARYLGAIVDEPGFVDELLEMNNTFVGPLMGVGFGPDLVVTQLNGPPTALPDGPLALAFEVCNQGTLAGPAAQVTFYDSADAVIEGSPPPAPGSDRWLGSEPVPGLAPGDCYAGSIAAWLPLGELGERRLGAIVDEWNSVLELVEANNAFSGAVLGVGSGPDLVVTRLLAPPSVGAGNPLAIDTQVCNQGTTSSPMAQLSLYLSSDIELEGSYSAPQSDPWLANSWVPPLAPGACHDEAVNAIASVTAEGPWYVGGIVDEGRHVAELVESNNAHLGDLVGVGVGPDLVITTLTGPSSVPAGASFFVDVEACNQGTAFSPPSKLILYHSEDLDIDGISEPLPFPDAVLAEIPLPGLAPATCHLESKSVVSSTPGVGFLAATVDEDQLVVELVEANNERLGDALEVTGPL